MNKPLISIPYKYLIKQPIISKSFCTLNNTTYTPLIKIDPKLELNRFYDPYLSIYDKTSLINSFELKKKEISRVSPLSLIETFSGFLEYTKQIDLVKKFIFSNFAAPKEGDNSLNELTEYYFTLSGKMIRPHFLIELSKYVNECQNGISNNKEFFNSDLFQNKIIPFASVIEALHNASLLQDDIIDNSESRRGKPTAHNLYGIRNTVFASNYILSKVVKVINDINIPQLNQCVAEVIHDLTYGEYKQTASVLSSAFRGVGLIMNLDHQNQVKLFNLGLHLGQLFQLVDDVLDVEGNISLIKKPAYKDLKEGVINSHILFELLDKNGPELINLIKKGFKEDSSLNRVLEILDEGTGIIKTKNLGLDHLLQTFNVLNDSFFVNNDTKKKVLQGIIFMFNRKF